MPRRNRVTPFGEVVAVPERGTFFGNLLTPDDRGGEAYLIREDDLLLWSHGGYTGRRPRPRGGEVTVLIPGSTVAAIRAGYEPEVHPSAFEA